MAGVSDKIFRQLCKEHGADVLTTEFVSAEGIFRRNERTREYLDFDEIERPIGVQLFGADAEHMAEAARQVIDWVRPDFIDLNFGCPVNKVVAKNGGSALLKDCPDAGQLSRLRWLALLRRCRSPPRSASVGMQIRSTRRVSRASCSMQESRAITVHGRTRAQGYAGAADWDTLSPKLPRPIPIPVIGNGDLASAADVAKRRRETGIAGAMIGRAAMSAPVDFQTDRNSISQPAKIPDAPEFIREMGLRSCRHCQLVVRASGCVKNRRFARCAHA